MAPQLKASFKCICLTSARIVDMPRARQNAGAGFNILSLKWSWQSFSLTDGTYRENTTSRAKQHNDIKLGHETCCEELKNTELSNHWSHSYRLHNTNNAWSMHILCICSWQNAVWRQICSLSRSTKRSHSLEVSVPIWKWMCWDLNLGFVMNLNFENHEKTNCNNGNHNERLLSLTETNCLSEKFPLVNILLY